MTAAVPRVREFKMPDVGEGLTEAEILSWYVQPGDAVTDGQVVCEVETAKAAVELPIPFDGTVHELRVPAGTTVDVGAVIITVDTAPGTPDDGATDQDTAGQNTPGQDTAGQDTAGTDGEQPGAAGSGEAPEGRQPVLVGYGVSVSATKRRPRKPVPGQPGTPVNGDAAEAGSGDRVPEQGTPAGTTPPATAPPAPASANQASHGGQGLNGRLATATPVTTAAPAAGRPLAKPPVRKLAKDLGIDLATVTPTGPDATITRDDIRTAATATPVPPSPVEEEATVTAVAPRAPSVTPQSLSDIRERRVPIKGVRKATAQAMVTSAFTAPHVTEFVTVDVTRTMKLVEKLKQDPDLAGVRINPLLLVAKALLVAIRRHPEVNAAWDEENQEIVQKDYVNLGIAAATPRGLLVPNIKDAGTKTLRELATALGELVSTAREGRTAPADMQGGTVTITNVGVFGIDTGTPILNPGESAILAFGSVRLQPWVHKDKVKPRQVTTLALSFDHRLVDGELGSRVLADVAAVLERPKRLMTWG